VLEQRERAVGRTAVGDDHLCGARLQIDGASYRLDEQRTPVPRRNDDADGAVQNCAPTLLTVIAYLHPAPAFGAVERYVVSLARGLRDAGEDLTLVYPGAPELEPFRELGGGSVRLAPFPPALLEATPRLVGTLVRRLRRLRPRVVHVTDVWPAAFVAARLAGVPRVVVTHHTPELPRRDNLAGRLLWRLGWLARPEVIYTSLSDREHDARRLRRHVIPLGIDLDRFEHATPELQVDHPVVGTVGRLASQKGQRYLIEAAPRVLERHPDVRFAIVGDGELRAQLEAQAAAAELDDRFLFTGMREDVAPLLASFDVFALPSLFEGLCLAVIEAQAAGVPVVATPVGGVKETVRAGETGVVCRPADPDSLADGIAWLLEHPEEAKRLAATARERVRERFSEQRMVQETLALYS
jgi:glycosyltransferase involved in cell wall biosynthesis